MTDNDGNNPKGDTYAEKNVPRGTFLTEGDTLLQSLRGLESRAVHTAIFAPPVGGWANTGFSGGTDRELSPEMFNSTPKTVGGAVETVVRICDEIRRILRDDGSLWLIFPPYTAHAISPKHHHASGNDSHPCQDVQNRVIDRITVAIAADDWRTRNEIICRPSHSATETTHDSVDNPPRRGVAYQFNTDTNYWYDLPAVLDPTGQGASGSNPGDILVTPETRGDCSVPQLFGHPIVATCPLRVCAACGAPPDPPGRDAAIGQRPEQQAGLSNTEQRGGDDPSIGSPSVYNGNPPACDCEAGTEHGTVLNAAIETTHGGVFEAGQAFNRRVIGIQTTDLA